MTCEIFESYDKELEHIKYDHPWDGNKKHGIEPEILDEIICTGIMHLWKDVNNSEWSCVCPDYTEEKRNKRDKKDQKVKGKRIMTIHNFNPKINNHYKQLDQVRYFPKSTYKVLIMTGNNGTGKTHLLNGLRKECLDNNMSTVYFEWRDLIDSFIPDKFDYDYEMRDKINRVKENKVDIIFIDELRADMKPFYYDEISYLIERHEGKIAIACNLKVKTSKQLLEIGGIEDRLKSRLFSNMEFVLMEGKDGRRVKKWRQDE